MDGVKKRVVTPYGNALVAARDFAPGDVVICDTPLLTTTESSELLDAIYDAHDELSIRADLLGKDASIDFTLQLLQYASADEATKAKVRRLFTPDLQACADEPYVRAALQYTTQLQAARLKAPEALAATVLAPLAFGGTGDTSGGRDGFSPDEMARVVLAWVCNSYATADGGGALYEHGSLVNHCCEGNTRYRYVEEGRGAAAAAAAAAADTDTTGGGCSGHRGGGGGGSGGGHGLFIAIRPIAAGEVITTCYLGWDEQTLLSTRMRRKLLTLTKLFTCTCRRCRSGRDPYRAVPCPACNAGRRGAGRGADEADSSGVAVTAAAGPAAGAAAAAMWTCPGAGPGAERTGGGVGCSVTAEEALGVAAAVAAGGSQRGDAGICGAGRNGRGASGSSSQGGGEAGGGGFLYWAHGVAVGSGDAETSRADDGAAAGCDEGGGPGRGGGGGSAALPWECDSCGRCFSEGEVRLALRRRSELAGFGPEGTDPELALEELVQGVGDRLDWSDLAVSLGTVRQLGARCGAVLGPRHWATNRCRYTVLELCTAALARTCVASRSGDGDDGSGGGARGGDRDGTVDGGGGCTTLYWSDGGREVSVRQGGDDDGGSAGDPAVVRRRGATEGEAGGGAAGDAAKTFGEVPAPSGASPSRSGAEEIASGAAEAAAMPAAEPAAAEPRLLVPAAAVSSSDAAERPCSCCLESRRPPCPDPPLAVDSSSQHGAGFAAAGGGDEDCKAHGLAPSNREIHRASPPGVAARLGADALGKEPTAKKAAPGIQLSMMGAGTPPALDCGKAAHVSDSGGVADALGAPPCHVNPHLGRQVLREHTRQQQVLHLLALQASQLQQQQQQQAAHQELLLAGGHDMHAAQQQQEQQQEQQLPQAGGNELGYNASGSPQSPPFDGPAHPGHECGDRDCQPRAGDGAAAAAATAMACAGTVGAATALGRSAGAGGAALAAPGTDPRVASAHGSAFASGAAADAGSCTGSVGGACAGSAPVGGVADGAAAGVVGSVGHAAAAAGAVGSVGGGSAWSLVEVEALVSCMCEELQVLWQWQAAHTPDAPELVLKAVAGPAATALMEAVRDERCGDGALARRALALAEAVAAALAASYAAAPFYDASGEAAAEAGRVVHLAPLLRSAMGLE